MLKFCYDHRGSISIFLLVIIVAMLVFSFLTLDIAKINLATAAARNNTDLAGNAALTDYDKILKDAYGLFANSSSMDELSKNVSEYYIATMSSNGIAIDNGNDIYNTISKLIDGADIPENNNMLNIKTSSLTLDIGLNDKGIIVQPISESAISNPTVMRHQIVEYMKYRAPVSLATGMLEKINVFKDVSNQTAATTDRIEYEDALNDVQNNSDSVYDIMESYTKNLGIINGGYTSGTITYGSKAIGDVSGLTKNGVTSLHNYYSELVKYTAQIAPFKDLVPNGQLTAKKIMIKPNTPENISDLSGLINSMSSNNDYNYLCVLYYANGDISTLVNDKDYNDKTYNLLKTIKSLYDSSLKNGPINGSVSDDLAKFYVKFYELYYGILENYENLTEVGRKEFDSYSAQFYEVDDMLSWAFGYPNTTAKSDYVPNKSATDGAIRQWAYSTYENTTDALNNYSNCFNDIASTLYYQEAIANFMGGDSSPLNDLKEAIDEAKKKSDEWDASINKVETESYKASMKNTHEVETENFDNLDPNAIENMKKDFLEQADAYGRDRSIIENRYGIAFKKEIYSESEGGNNWGYSALPSVNYNVQYKNERETDIFLKDINIDDGFNYSDFLSYVPNPAPSNLSVNSTEFLAAFNNGTNKDIYEIVKKISEKNIIADKDDREEMKESGEKDKKNVNDEKEKLAEQQETETKKQENSSTNNMSDVSDIVSFNDYIQSNLTSVPQYGTSISGVNIDDMEADSSGNYDTSNVTDLLFEVGSMFSNLAKTGRDNLFIAEYLTGMFSCMTTGVKDDKEFEEESMAGYVFSEDNNLHYQAELEYILYGLDTEFKNKAAAIGTISSIRFVLNLIYSFTDSEINAFTTSTASALGAVFPFAIPVIKTVLHILLSAAETSWDMIELSKGNSVPIYKTQRTWVCKGTNIVGNIIDETAKEAVTVVRKKLEQGISDYIDGKEEGLNEWVNKMVDAKEEELESILESKIITPLNEAVTQLTANASKSIEDIENELNSYINNIINDISNPSDDEVNGDSILSTIYSQMAEYLKSNKSSIVANLKNASSSLINTAKNNAQSYATQLKEQFESATRDIIKKIEDVVESVKDKINEAVTSAAKEVKELAVNGINTASDKLLDAVDSKISSKLSGTRNVNINMGSTSSSGGNKLLDSLLCMSYKDYLYLFLILGLINGSETELTRAAQLMQCNIQHRGQNDYDINTSVTMFNVYTSSKVKTSVMGRVADSNGITMKHLSDGYYNIEIRSFVGY